MKTLLAVIFLFVLQTLNSCQGQEAKAPRKISEFNFDSIFGMTSTEPKNTYCLLGAGFFRTPRSDNSDSLITTWIKSHPDAFVIPVSSFGPTETKDKDSKMIYCWVIDQNDTLNNYLVKNGCFPGGTMVRPRTWEEMGKEEQDSYKEVPMEKPDVKVYIDKTVYEKFIEQIKAAELYASENKLGIWLEDSNKEEE